MPSNVSNLPRNSARFAAGSSSFLRLSQDIADAADVVDQSLLGGPFRLKPCELLLQCSDFGLECCNAFGVLYSQIAVIDERGFLGLASCDGDARILDQGWRRALADRHPRCGGIQQADGLVRQLPRRDVAVREVYGGHDGGVGDADAMVLLHRSENARAT